MPTTFRPCCQPDRLLLLSSELRECLPPANRAHHVSYLVGPVELGAFYVSREGDDRRHAPHESMDAVDAGEDERYGEEVRGEALPAKLQRPKKRLVAIERATGRLEAAQPTADDACGRRAGSERAGRASASMVSASSGRRATSPTPSYDPESRIMNTSTEGSESGKQRNDGPEIQ